MKTFIPFVFFLLVSFCGVSQTLNFDMISQSQNKLLDKYGIDFTGAHVRNMVVNGGVNDLKIKSISDSMVAAYNRFMVWNDGSFNVIPDTNNVKMTGEEYLQNKTTENGFINMGFMGSRVLSIYHQEIKQDSINSIEILEFIKLPGLVQTAIFIENDEGVWNLFYYTLEDTEFDCPPCTVP